MNNFVQLFRTVCHLASPCFTLRYFAPQATLCHFVQLCATLCHFVPLHSTLLPFVPLYTVLFNFRNYISITVQIYIWLDYKEYQSVHPGFTLYVKKVIGGVFVEKCVFKIL